MGRIKSFKFLLLGSVLLISGCATLAAQSSELPKGPLEVALKEYSIGTGEIKFVASKEPVKVTIMNKGSSPHDFVIQELGVDSGILNSGESITLEIIAKDAAVFQAKCTLPGHTEAGMVAKVIVGQ